MGNLANRMIQYMVALALARRVPGAVLSQIELPEWGIQIAPVQRDVLRTEIVTAARVDLDSLARMLNEARADRVDLRTYGQHFDNFLPADAYRAAFRAPGLPCPPGAADELLCNIRQGDILDGHHPDYVLVPADFYGELIAQTGLKPVFMGQLDDTPYLAALKRRFPHARFIPSLGATTDFEMIRRSKNIVLSVSSFAWLAAWLSDAEQIFMPLLGLLNPMQCRGTRLVPLDDARYRFYLFPHAYAVPVAQFEPAHAALRGLWRRMKPDQLAVLMAGHSPPAQRCLHLEIFDEAFYLRNNPDIAAAVADGHFPSGRHHYENFGFGEGREPCRVDKAWYCQAYPIAAVELGQGDWPDPVRHFIELGQFRGYRRVPG
jgi:hypothetical protein